MYLALPAFRFIAAVVLSMACASSVIAAPSLTDAEQAEVINALSVELIKRYVFPDKAQSAMDRVRQYENEGSYRSATDPEQFAALLTTHLQQTTGDKHLQVGYRATPIPLSLVTEPKKPAASKPIDPTLKFEKTTCLPGKVVYYHIGSTECMVGQIGYIKVGAFVNNAEEAIASAMTRLSDTKVLIIDVRDNGGGYPETVAELSSYLFEQRTHLNDLYWRGSNRTVEFWTKDVVAGRKFGQQKDVYVLTGPNTFSAAEEFAYTLKVLKRATLVGAITRGGAHAGGPIRLTAHFGAFIPYGRPINPVTGTNWEGVGVVPDVAVFEDKALTVAQIMALKNMLKTETRSVLKAQLRARLSVLKREMDE